MTLDPQAIPRRLSTCHRHPEKPVTGFCALCLHERLAGLDSSSAAAATSTSGGGGANATSGRIRSSAAASSSLKPELRRCKSYSVSKCGAAYEPRRKSCDVGGRNTLWRLFNIDDEENGRTEVESKNLGLSGVTGSVFESRAEVKNGDKIRVSEDALGQNLNVNEEIVEEVEEELKTMKEHIELEWQSRKHTGRDLKDIAGSFWVAASVFTQKLRKWRLKQRTTKRRSGYGSRRGDLLPAEKLNGRQLRETQSEVGDYGYGRRSCDADPRFSLDACRMSLDDPRFSFDEPRASWDGYMIARTIPRLAPMLSVIENVMIPPINKSEYGMSVEEQMTSIIEDEMTSGGSAQTRDYCSDSSSSHRQNSFDCSSSSRSSNKKTVAVEVDEMKSMSNTQVSPSTIGPVFHRMKFVVTDRDATDSSDFNSIKFDHLESLESTSKDDTCVAGGGGGGGGGYLNRFKKSGRWRKAWTILGFKHRLTEGNVIGHPLGDCESKQSEEANGVVNGALLARSGTCVSSRRSSGKMMGSYRRSLSVAETRGFANNKSREESALERNRSARYSPSNFDNGLLRFHLTPLWSGRRKSGRNRLKNSHSIARTVLRLS